MVKLVNGHAVKNHESVKSHEYWVSGHADHQAEIVIIIALAWAISIPPLGSDRII